MNYILCEGANDSNNFIPVKKRKSFYNIVEGKLCIVNFTTHKVWRIWTL